MAGRYRQGNTDGKRITLAERAAASNDARYVYVAPSTRIEFPFRISVGGQEFIGSIQPGGERRDNVHWFFIIYRADKDPCSLRNENGEWIMNEDAAFVQALGEFVQLWYG